MLQVQSVVAEYERAKILERSRRGKRHAARSGRVSVLGHAPYGYRYIRKSDCDGEAQYQVVLEQARVVQRMFEWVAFEGCSLREVARRLMAETIPSPCGLSHWHPNTIGELLKHTAYTGTAFFGKSRNAPPRLASRPRRGSPAVPRSPRNRQKTEPQDQIPIAVPALVDPEVFALVGQRLARNQARHGRRPVHPRALLSGLVVCMNCGYAYYLKRTGQRKTDGPSATRSHLYYRCPGRDRTRFGGESICDSPMLPVDRLDAAVWDDVRAVLLEPARIEREYERRLGELEAERPSAADSGKLVADLRRRISRLLEMYEEGYLDKETFRRRMDTAKARLSQLEAEAKAMREQAEEVQELKLVMGCLEGFAARVREGLEQGDAAVKRTIVEALIQEVKIGDETIRVVYRVSPPPFAERPEWGVVSNCHASYTRLVDRLGWPVGWCNHGHERMIVARDAAKRAARWDCRSAGPSDGRWHWWLVHQCPGK
jgi:site-specific DNA recombinase